jgi:acetyl-CoA acetyltransferase
MELTMPMGMYSAAHQLAICASHYMHRYGVTRETFGWIALNARANAARNPDAIYRTPLTMDDYLSARMISTPFGLYDCDVPCDGAIAVIVSAAETAADLPGTPVWIDAVGTQITERVTWDQSTLTHEPQVLGPAAHLWTRSQYQPQDVDFAELYDGFTFNCVSWLEGLGFCDFGEAKDFVEGGRRIALNGELPLNTHGGQLSHGRTHGFGLLHEAVTQLRGAAGERQVPSARVGVVRSCRRERVSGQWRPALCRADRRGAVRRRRAGRPCRRGQRDPDVGAGIGGTAAAGRHSMSCSAWRSPGSDGTRTPRR